MGELHAELGVGSAMMWIVISTPGTTGVEGAGGTGGHGRASRSTTPSEARVWRSRGRPGPTAPGTPAEPQATSSIANYGCAASAEGTGGTGGHKRAWLRCPWAAAGTGRASSQRAEPHISDQAPPVWRAQEGPAAVPVGGGGAWPSFEPTRRATH